MCVDKLDGFRKRKTSAVHGEEEDEDEEKGEKLSLKEYLQRKQDEYDKEGKPTKKRVRKLYCVCIYGWVYLLGK